MNKKIDILKFILVIVISIITIETLIMFVFNFLCKNCLSDFTEVIIDAIVLIIFLLPIIYFFLYLPMRKGLNKVLEAEKEIKQKNDELVHQNEEILTQRDLLINANKELEKLNNTKNKFFSIIAHDLKNPFAGMLSSLELLKRTLEKEPENHERIIRYAESIHLSTQNGFKLLENLLEWSRTQRGEIKYNPDEIFIIEIIKDSISSIQSCIENKNLKIIYEDQPYKVFADKDMLFTILRNLISNAVKFTPINGLINIELNKHVDVLEVLISDSGAGMSDEVKENLFKLGYKNSTFGTQNEKGTGLGLILCREFIEKNGGRIWVESKLGFGSKFYFTLPLMNKFNNHNISATHTF